MEESMSDLTRTASSQFDLTGCLSGYLERMPLKPAKRKFRSVIRAVIICVGLCKVSRKSMEASRGEFMSVYQYKEELVEKGGLMFDRSNFKIDKEVKLGQEAKRILLKRPQERSSKEIEYLLIILRSIGSFAEYPRRMQKGFSSVGWYESYDSMRAIVRQGHPPRSFYFILSGTVVVTSFDNDTRISRTLVVLHRGMTFGELAVVTCGVRLATVTSQTPVELLCISVTDFENIFMSTGLQARNSSEWESFLRHVRFLKHFPVDLLLANSQACMFHYFNRGQVLVRDSNNSNWIYIVKSGSISVMKKLKAVEPKHVHQEHRWHRSKKMYKVMDGEQSGGPELATEHSCYRSTYEMDKKLDQTLPGYWNQSDRLGTIPYDSIIQKHKGRLRKKSPIRSVELSSLSEIQGSGEFGIAELRLPMIRQSSKGSYFSLLSPRRRKSRKQSKEDELVQIRQRQIEKVRKQEENLKGRKTIAEELDNAPPVNISNEDSQSLPMFVLVDVLERGQYFGVSSLVFNGQPSLSVVSNGAECIMVSKKLFLQHTSEKDMDDLTLTVYPYPQSEEMQGNLQHYVNWKEQRSRIYKRLVHSKQINALRKKQFTSQFLGQYCFRTGPF